MTDRKIIIAIDGHSSSGKSTLSKDLAAKLKYNYIDSGSMYRTVTLYAIRNNLVKNGVVDSKKLIEQLDTIFITFKYNPEEQKSDTYLNGENVEKEIRGLEVSNQVSPVATIKEVRQAMVKIQKQLGKDKGIVMDGRDIGTVVYPEAELKVFVTTSPKIRAKRRFDELKAKGESVTFDEVLKNVEERDFIDQTRKESPLKKAPGSITLDNGNMTREEQLNWVLTKVNEVLNDH
jgi:CMP/dCMP kinase